MSVGLDHGRGHGGSVVPGGNGDDPGECHSCPFDPRPPRHKDPLHSVTFRVSPIEHPSQHALLMNAVTSCSQQVAVCHTHSAHTQYMQSTKLRLPGGKSMTPNSCNTCVVHRLDLRPQRSRTQSAGSALIRCDGSLPCGYLPLFRAAPIQSMFQGWDPTMEESQEGTDRHHLFFICLAEARCTVKPAGLGTCLHHCLL